MEALARGLGDGRRRSFRPSTLFKMAEAERLAGAVEDLCRWSAVHRFAGLPRRSDDLLLFLNLDLVSSPSHEALPA